MPAPRRRSGRAERPNCRRPVDIDSRAAKLSFRSGGPMPSEACGSKARQSDGQNHDHGDHRAGDYPTHINLPFLAPLNGDFLFCSGAADKRVVPRRGSCQAPKTTKSRTARESSDRPAFSPRLRAVARHLRPRCEKVETGFSREARSHLLESITFSAFERFCPNAA